MSREALGRRTLLKKNVPMPIILIDSYSTAEKYDSCLKILSKEYPQTIKNFENEKKSIQEKKKTLLDFMNCIKVDVQVEMKSSIIELDILYKKEQDFTREKDKDLKTLESDIEEAENRKKNINEFIVKYLLIRNKLDSLAKSNKFHDIRSLVRHYLLVQSFNEIFIQKQLNNVTKLESIGIKLAKHKELNVIPQRYDAMKLEKKFESLMQESADVKNKCNDLHHQLDCIHTARVKEHENWEFLRRWIKETHHKINQYKETTYSSKDDIKQLDEIQDFITTSRKFLKR